MRKIICLSLIVICAAAITPARKLTLNEINVAPFAAATLSRPPMPDLIVRGNEFEFIGNKMVNVYISNNGDAPSKRCLLELTVRKIGNASVGRMTKAIIPALQPGKYTSIKVDATSILPANVNLKDTTFKVVADSNNSNAESNEDNNEKWHNLQ